jgi:proline iminopeptidase
MLERHPLYPEVEPRQSGTLAVDNRHTLYWERIGNPNGVPALFLHSGPGGGIRPANRRNYDPQFFDVTLFDQRGCGRSTPLNDLAGNDTQNLVEDIEKLRKHLGIDRWLVTGGSWGSFLSLAYAQAHPERCLGLIVRGIFTGGDDEIHWWYYGIRNLFPEAWETFASFLPAEERGDLLHAYWRRVTSDDPKVNFPAAHALRTYSGWTQSFRATQETVNALLAPEMCVPLARFFTHFCVNRFFMKPGQLLADMPKIRHLPGIIVQGRYDVVTRAEIAYKLARAWPEAELQIVIEAGHNSTEPVLAESLTAAYERMKARLAASGQQPRP